MLIKHLLATIPLPNSPSPLRIAYLDSPATTKPLSTILLIHGFPQTSHQFRHIIPLLTSQGHRCITPTYRGAGSSRPAPTPDFRKTTMAGDMVALLDHLDIDEKVYVVGHDIGGNIAFAFASRWPERVRSVIWGENSLPGTEMYRLDRTVPARTTQQFHFVFHTVPELASSLVAGKERVYVEHFLRKICYNLDAFSDEDIDFYAHAYSQPGAMRDAMEVYAVLERDAEENLEWVTREGKCRVPTMVVNGEMSYYQRTEVESMAKEVTDEEFVEVGVVKGSGHYLAEESPEKFVRVVLEFVGRH